MSRALTTDELRAAFLNYLRAIVQTTAPEHREAVTQALFSTLVAIDGMAGGLPFALDLVARVHPDDEAFHKAEGSDWIPDGATINDGDEYLHDEWKP